MRASGPDRIGLLATLTYALNDVGVVVHHASVDTAGGTADDSFEISDANGRKLTDSAAAEIAGAVAALCDPA
jgi:UTP:GlnB (protein PII) uridylyltransferase